MRGAPLEAHPLGSIEQAPIRHAFIPRRIAKKGDSATAHAHGIFTACCWALHPPSTMVALFVRTHVTYSGWWMHGKGETAPSEEAPPSCALATLTLQAAHLSYSPSGETQSFARS